MTEVTVVTDVRGGTRGGGPGALCPLECDILTLTLWVLHGKNEAKSQWCPTLGGAVPPLVVTEVAARPAGGG